MEPSKISFHRIQILFQIRRIQMQICHAITACFIKLSYHYMEKKSSFRVSLAHYNLPFLQILPTAAFLFFFKTDYMDSRNGY